MQATTSTITPGSAQQALAIHYEEALVATARYQRAPSEAHKALMQRRDRWLLDAGGVTELDERGRQLAESIAAERLADDDLVGRCLCGQHCTSPSDSPERVTAAPGRESPRAAAN